MKTIHAPANNEIKEYIARKLRKIREVSKRNFFGSQEVSYHTGQAVNQERRKIAVMCSYLGVSRKKYKKIVKKRRAIKRETQGRIIQNDK